MRSITRHTGTLQILQRLPSSYYGNPRYLALVDGHVFRTSVDSSLAYSLPNYDGKRVEVELGSHYGKLTLNALRTAR